MERQIRGDRTGSERRKGRRTPGTRPPTTICPPEMRSGIYPAGRQGRRPPTASWRAPCHPHATHVPPTCHPRRFQRNPRRAPHAGTLPARCRASCRTGRPCPARTTPKRRSPPTPAPSTTTYGVIRPVPTTRHPRKVRTPKQAWIFHISTRLCRVFADRCPDVQNLNPFSGRGPCCPTLDADRAERSNRKRLDRATRPSHRRVAVLSRPDLSLGNAP